MEIRQLRYFAEVAHVGSISAAAERLHVSQSAVSRQVADLEAELRVMLFRRRSDGVALTDSGAIFLEGTSDVLRRIDALATSMGTRAEAPQVVRLGMPPSLSPIVDAAFVALLARAPVPVSVQAVEASTFWLQQRLDAADLACAILTNGRGGRTVDTEALWTEQLFLLGPNDAPYADREMVTLADAASYPLMLTPLVDATRQTIEAAFRAAGLEPCVQQEHEAMTLLASRLGDQTSHTILSRAAVGHLADRLHLAAVPIEGLRIRRVLSTRRGAMPARVFAKIATTIRNEARRRFADDRWIDVASGPTDDAA